MSKFETPLEFDTNLQTHNFEINYSNLSEIVQGGPVTGEVSVNGITISRYRFGGPMLCDGDYIFMPVLTKKILGWGFKLARINLQTLDITFYGRTRDLIFLSKIENNRVYFFEDLDKTIIKYNELTVVF